MTLLYEADYMDDDELLAFIASTTDEATPSSTKKQTMNKKKTALRQTENMDSDDDTDNDDDFQPSSLSSATKRRSQTTSASKKRVSKKQKRDDVDAEIVQPVVTKSVVETDPANKENVQETMSIEQQKPQVATEVQEQAQAETSQSAAAPIASRDKFELMRLRRIVKENHGSDINQVIMFPSRRTVSKEDGDIQEDLNVEATNLVATVGSAQANIYDNEHCGDHLDIMSHFVIDGQGYESSLTAAPVGELKSCCWLSVPSDAVLACAGSDNIIHILSLANSKEIKQLTGHKSMITDLQSHPINPHLLLSASKDNTVRLWHVGLEKCLAEYSVEATVLCVHASGKTFLAGSSNGDIAKLVIPQEFIDMTSIPKSKTISMQVIDSRVPLVSSAGAKFHSAYIDCMRYVGDNVVSKSINGKIVYWNSETKEIIHKITVKGGNNTCRFDVSPDNAFLCVGTSQASILVYDLNTAELIKELTHRRVTKAVRCCAFARGVDNILFAGEDAIIWRYDYVSKEMVDDWNKSQITA